MRKLQFKYLVVFLLIFFPYLCTLSIALGQQRYNPPFYITSPPFRYDPSSREWRYVPPDSHRSTVFLHPYTDKVPEGGRDITHPGSVRLYDHSTKTWQDLEPDTILQYNPLEQKWELLE